MIRIETPNLTLRAFENSDFDAVHAYASDPAVTHHQAWGPNSEDDTRAFIDRSRRGHMDEPATELQFAIVVRSSGDVVGGCGIRLRRAECREYELGYTLNPRYWGRGIAFESVSRAVAYAFETLNAHRVYASIDPENAASIVLIERLGFILEGHHRADTLIRGEWRDTLVYARLEPTRR